MRKIGSDGYPIIYSCVVLTRNGRPHGIRLSSAVDLDARAMSSRRKFSEPTIWFVADRFAEHMNMPRHFVDHTFDTPGNYRWPSCKSPGVFFKKGRFHVNGRIIRMSSLSAGDYVQFLLDGTFPERCFADYAFRNLGDDELR